MSFFLVAEDGPYAGSQVWLKDRDEYVFGRDVDSCFETLEDPSVSRNHTKFYIQDDQCYVVNLSQTNPTLVNGKPLEDPYPLNEEDIIQIGNTFYRFTQDSKLEGSKEKTDQINADVSIQESLLANLTSDRIDSSTWLLKVITGPNRGAEFSLKENQTYILGKNASECDLIFQDHSVSKKHASIVVSEDAKAYIQDLSSLNGVWINNEKVKEKQDLKSQDIISLGTTSFIILDRSEDNQTIVSVSQPPGALFAKESASEEASKLKEAKSLKDLFIPTKHLAFAAIFGVFVIFISISMLALFRSQTVKIAEVDYSGQIESLLKPFKEVTFNYNKKNAKLFIMGHVLTDVEYNKLHYLLNNASFIKDVQDNVIVDEGVWESTNTLLSKNPNWKSSLIMAYNPGVFILQGYVTSQAIANELFEFVSLNFPYVSLLSNQIIVTDNLYRKIKNILFEKNLFTVGMQGSNGTISLNGRVSSSQAKILDKSIEQIQKLKGVKTIKNFVIVTGQATISINVTSKYKVAGVTKLGNVNQFVLINGKILAKGDMLDGMIINQITMNTIFLSKEGLKYKIDYNS